MSKKNENKKSIEEVRRSFQTHCMKVINRTKVNKKEEIIQICGKITESHILHELKGLLYRLDLCKEHTDEFEQKEKERKEKEKKDFIETEMICPKCGEKVFKHFHRYDNYLSQIIEYRWFWCRNMCDLGCGCCNKVDTHGDCCTDFCHSKSKWEPIKRVKK